MQITNELSKYHLVPLVFEADPVAGSLTDVQLGDTMDRYIAPFAGTIIAVSASLAGAATLGTLTIGPTVNGTEKTALTLTVTTGTAPYTTTLRDAATFSAGDALGAEITTSATWNGTGLRVVVWAMLTLAGI